MMDGIAVTLLAVFFLQVNFDYKLKTSDLFYTKSYWRRGGRNQGCGSGFRLSGCGSEVRLTDADLNPYWADPGQDWADADPGPDWADADPV